MHNYLVTLESREYSVQIGDDNRIIVDGRLLDVDITRSGKVFSVLLDGSSITVVVDSSGAVFHALINGLPRDILVESDRERLLKKFSHTAAGRHERSEVHAPMPALVVRVEVEVGDEVQEGQGLMVLEAMKMENELKAHQPGRVKQVLVSRGKAVEKGELLLLLE